MSQTLNATIAVVVIDIGKNFLSPLGFLITSAGPLAGPYKRQCGRLTRRARFDQ